MEIKPVIVYCPGSWDMLHVGHTNIFKQAKKLGDILIVGVSSDKLILKYKNIFPIISYKDRASVIQDLKYVNKVIKQDKFFDIKQLKKLKIDIIVLGDDWKGKHFPELDKCLRELKIQIAYVPYTKRLSSSKIKETIINNAVKIIKAQNKRK